MIKRSREACIRTRMPKAVKRGTEPVSNHMRGLRAPWFESR
jgi:hypothetical protein